MTHTLDLREYRMLMPGEIVEAGDEMRIYKLYETIRMCKYDKQGQTCCVGQEVTEANRFFRKL
jgi:hypothetical protein